MGIFYEKAFPAVKAAVRRVKFSGFTAEETEKKGVLRATGGENCEIVSGRLAAGIGVSPYPTDEGINPPLSNPSDPPAAFALLPVTDENGARKNALTYVSEMGFCYFYNAEKKRFDFARVFDDVPAAVPFYREDGTATLAFCGAEGVWLQEKEGKMTQVYAGKASPIACAFHERLFFVERPFCVRFCAPLTPTDWADGADEGGHIEFPSEKGALVGLAALGEAVYAFREREIVRLDARGAARDFSARVVPYGGGRIFEGSAGACGEKIFFLAEDGVYSFDGAAAKRICQNLPVFPLSGRQVCEHAAFEGKYFLRYAARGGEKKLLIVDGESGTGYFSSSAPFALSETENCLLCAVGGKIYRADAAGDLPTGAEYRFEAAGDFGVAGRKLWKTLSLKGEGGCVAEVKNGRESVRRAFSFSYGEARTDVLLKGETFTLTLRLEKGARLWGAEAEFVVYGG